MTSCSLFAQSLESGVKACADRHHLIESTDDGVVPSTLEDQR